MNIVFQILLFTLLIFLKAFAFAFGLYCAYLIIKRISPTVDNKIDTVLEQYKK